MTSPGRVIEWGDLELAEQKNLVIYPAVASFLHTYVGNTGH
jgi:hypothetical protein